MTKYVLRIFRKCSLFRVTDKLQAHRNFLRKVLETVKHTKSRNRQSVILCESSFTFILLFLPNLVKCLYYRKKIQNYVIIVKVSKSPNVSISTYV